MTIQWATPSRKGRGSASNKSGVYLSSSRASEDRQAQLTIVIQADAMEAMRWVVGDRVILGCDSETGIFVLCRHPDGFKLTSRSTRKRQDSAGLCIAANVKMKTPSFIDEDKIPASVALADCELDGAQLRFVLY
jgi:hypothetical protein